MYAEDGGLLELLEPLADWVLVVKHSCTQDGELHAQKFHLANSKGEYIKAARLEPVS